MKYLLASYLPVCDMIISEKHSKVIMRLQYPNTVLATIPTARTFEYKGETLVAVPHGIDETQVLNNLGFKVPSAITYEYRWSGMFKPFDAQNHTADFLVRNNRAFLLSEMGCVDSETEYLSPTGWVKISEYVGGAVGQYHPDTGHVEFVQPERYVKLPCSEMYHLKTKYGLDQMLSPEHRVLLQDRSSSRTETVQAETLYQRQEDWINGVAKCRGEGISWGHAAIPTTYRAQGGGIGLTEAQLRLQIACIADGHYPNKTNVCRLNLKKERKKKRLAKLLAACNIKYREVCKDDGFSIFTFKSPRREKDFSQWWSASSDQLEVIADEVMHWDGHVKANRRQFSSTSKASADFVQHVFCTQGFTSRVCTYSRLGKVEYVVSIRSEGKPLMVASRNSFSNKNRTMNKVPSSDGFKYCFMVPSTYLIFRRNGCVFASGNTGKSLTCLWAYDYIRKKHPGTKMLVVAPLSTLESTWADEIFTHFMHLQSVVLHGARKRRLKLLDSEADIYIINHDGVAVIRQELIDKGFDIVVVDEIASFRNTATDRWKALNSLTSKVRRVWGLTGTPTPNYPTDAYGQCKLICPEKVPKFFTAFRDSTMRRVSQFQWEPKEGATEIVKQAMQPAIRYTRDSCVDIPECMYSTRSVQLSPDQKKAYDSMASKLVAEVSEGEVTAVNAAVKAQKLLQIAGGVLYSDNDPYVIKAPDRIKVLRETIEQVDGKVIVFVPFRGMIDYVCSELQDYEIGVIHGGVSSNKRAEVFRAFQHGNHMKVLVAQPAAMSHGLTLTASNTIVWYAPITSTETYIQANARITRPGQKKAQFIIHLLGTPLERKMNAKLTNRQKVQDILLELLQSGSV